MKNCKRICCLILSLLFIFALCACGNDDNTAKGSEENVKPVSGDNGQPAGDDGEGVTDVELEVEPKPVTVEDALNYEKDIIATKESLEIGWDPAGGKHKIRLPEITADTDNAKKLNQKIYDTYKNAYDTLTGNREEGDIYYCDYVYKIYDGLIGIIVNSSVGVQCGGISPGYNVFYYDVENDKELTYEEYLNELGLSEEKLHIKISNTKAYQNSETVIGGILASIIDTESTVIIAEAPETMDGWLEVTTEPIV